MNIEESIEYLKNYKYDNEVRQAIETLLTAYEEKCKELKKEIQDDLDVRNRWGLTLQDLEKEKEKNKNAYRKANNYLYFNDSADYEVALWEVVRTLRPDLAEKWDNGEDIDLEYIEEE